MSAGYHRVTITGEAPNQAQPTHYYTDLTCSCGWTGRVWVTREATPLDRSMLVRANIETHQEECPDKPTARCPGCKMTEYDEDWRWEEVYNVVASGGTDVAYDPGLKEVMVAGSDDIEYGELQPAGIQCVNCGYTTEDRNTLLPPRSAQLYHDLGTIEGGETMVTLHLLAEGAYNVQAR